MTVESLLVDDGPIDLSDRMVWLRKQRGLSQKQLAHRAMTTSSRVCSIEHGLYSGMTALMLYRLAKALGTTMDYIWTGEDNHEQAHD